MCTSDLYMYIVADGHPLFKGCTPIVIAHLFFSAKHTTTQHTVYVKR